MIEGLKPYAEYKESGLPWLGRVPTHWEIKRAKSIFQRIDIRSKTGKEELLTVSSARGIVPRNSATVTMFKAESYLGYKLCWPGDLVINSLWAWGGGLGVSSHHGIISSAYGVYRIRKDAPITPAFVHEVVRSSSFNWELQVRSKGVWISRLQLTDVSFLDAPVHMPQPDEQAGIVRFLDHANRKIDGFIRAKRKLIGLLHEQKQGIIHRAVTRGLNPNVPLKPSGIPWLGDIPMHWEVKRLKWVTRLQRGYDLPADIRKRGTVPVVSSGGIIDTHNESKATGPGVVMGRYGSTDAIFYLEEDFWPHNTSLFVTTFYENLPKWCFYLLRTISKADHASKSAVPGVDRKDLYDIYVPHPPADEQPLIVSGIEENAAIYDAAIARTQREIALMHEYRTRLTADIVTGKLDVRDTLAELAGQASDVVENEDVEGVDLEEDGEMSTA